MKVYVTKTEIPKIPVTLPKKKRVVRDAFSFDTKKKEKTK